MLDKTNLRIAFLGTPDFAVPSLQALLEEHYNVVGVFTQPDKPVGRKQILQPTPVKAFAQAHGLKVFQPVSLKSTEGIDLLKSLNVDLMITAAFGQILSREVLSIPKLGCINVHGSLLPKYRGAAPIQCSIIFGETETGVTTMFTDEGIDTGDMLLQNKIKILPEETAGELFPRVADLGAKTLIETLVSLISGELRRTPQEHSRATHCKMLKKEDGKIDWSSSAKSICNLVRGSNPWPGAFCTCDSDIIKIWSARPASDFSIDPSGASPGDILCCDPKRGLFIATGDGAIEIIELQLSGGKRLNAREFLRGRNFPDGSVFR